MASISRQNTPLISRQFSRDNSDLDSVISGGSGHSSNTSLVLSQNTHGFGRSTGNLGTLMNLVKAMVGTGILAMPSAFNSSGLMLGLGLILLLAIICTHCMHMLVNGAHSLQRRYGLGAMDYSAVMHEAVCSGPERCRGWGRNAGHVITLFLLLTQFGFCCVYVLFVAQSIKQVVHYYWANDPSLTLYTLAVAGLLIPYCCIRSLKLLSYFALAANVFTILGLGIVFSYVLSHTNSWRSLPQDANSAGVALFFGTAVFAFEGIGIILPLENSMKYPGDLPGWTGVLNLGMTIVSTLYAAMGFYGFLSFGDTVCGSITLNLPNDILYLSTKLMFAFGLFISYGLQLYVPVGILWPLIHDRLQARVSSSLATASEFVFRTLLVIASAGLAVAIPYLDLFISLIGSLCSSTLALIFPAIIDICVHWESTEGSGRRLIRVSKNVVICVVGLLGLFTGSYETIKAIAQAFHGTVEDTCST